MSTTQKKPTLLQLNISKQIIPLTTKPQHQQNVSVNFWPCSETSAGGFESDAFGLRSSTTAGDHFTPNDPRTCFSSIHQLMELLCFYYSSHLLSKCMKIRCTISNSLCREVVTRNVQCWDKALHGQVSTALNYYFGHLSRPVPSSERQRTAVPNQSHLSVK